jgi:hypothetical protein
MIRSRQQALPRHRALMEAPGCQCGDYTIHLLEKLVADRTTDAAG